MLKEIIINNGYSMFVPDIKLERLVESCGYDNVWDINARMDQRIIKFIKDKTNSQNKKDIIYDGKKDEYGFGGWITVVEVDTSRHWLIDNYDGGEGILYLTLCDERINYYEATTY